MINRIHPRHDRQQHLRRADVARRLFPADMLLARLKRQSIAPIARASFDTPMIRPGIFRACSVLVAM